MKDLTLSNMQNQDPGPESEGHGQNNSVLLSTIDCLISASVLYKFGYINIFNLRQIDVDLLVNPPTEDVPSTESDDDGDDLPEGLMHISI